MILTIYHEGRVYRVECPDGSRVYQAPPDIEDCLILPPSFPGPRFLLTPFAIAAARRGENGLRLIDEAEAV